MNLFEILNRRITRISNLLLLIVVFFFIFLIPFFPNNWHKILNPMTFSIIFLVSIFVLNSWRRTMFTIAVIAFITEWIAYWIHMPVLNFVSSLTNIIFFQIIVIKLIIQIAKSKIADSRVIFESINGYLMLGLLFTLWIAIAMQYDSGSFSFQVEMPVVQDYIYFTFVTMTTLGYGDVTPLLPFARSLAILISISGQIYIAVIIAMLVGKYASQESTK